MQFHPLTLLACLLTAVAAVLYSPAHARDTATDDRTVTPESIDGVTIVDAEGLIDKVAATAGLVLIDARIPSDRSEGYIEGSVSLPDTDTNCDSLRAIAPYASWPVMFYCNGVKCGRSAKSAQIARDCGYTRVFWYRNGMEGWQAKQYPVVQ